MACVYKHLKPDGTIFYIGIGKTTKRAYSLSGRNLHWKRTTKKYGYSIEFIYKDIPWDEAVDVEKYLIAYYGRKDLNKGNLVNMTDGGEKGTIGLIHSKETRLKMSNSIKKAWENGKFEASVENRKGYKLSKETKLKMRNVKLGRKHSIETLEKIKKAAQIVPEERRIKMSLNNARGHSNKVIDISTGIIYNTTKDAFNKLEFKFSYKYLTSMLRGDKRNKTTLMYYKDGV